jgi:hypothetical protein
MIDQLRNEISILQKLLDFEVLQRDEGLQKYVITDYNEEWFDEKTREFQLQEICDRNAFIVPLRENLKLVQLHLEYEYEKIEKVA